MQSRKPRNLAGKVARRVLLLSAKLAEKRRHLVWRMRKRPSGDTVPLFIFGSQRSGTSMLGECLGKSPEIENMGETDSRAFTDFFLKDLETIGRLLTKSTHNIIVFKPLKDSHRVGELMSVHAKSRAVWAYRSFADRINSAVAKFGRHPLDVFENYKNGRGKAWQLADISDENAQLIRDMDIARLTESDGAALMWYIRNSLFFDQNLENDERVLLWSYDDFVAHPESDMRSIARFLEFSYHDYMTSAVHSASIGKNARPEIDPRIDELCSGMLERLDAARARRK